MTNLPFARKPPSKCKQEPYYWRGGDVLREREYLADEFKKALYDYRLAEFNLKQSEQELKQKNDLLYERDQYTQALAGFLDGDSEGGQIEGEYKRRLIAIEEEMALAERELRDARAIHHPAVASGLQKEKAYLIIENQRTSKAVDLADEQTLNAKRQLAACTVSNKYRTILAYEVKLTDLLRKKKFLRERVIQNKFDFDALRPVIAAQTPEAVQERNALFACIKPSEELKKLEDKLVQHPKKFEFRLHRVIEDIEELNGRLLDLGLTANVVDVNELRAKYLPSEVKSAPPEGEEDAEEEEDATAAAE
jgi:hypothetical protein